MNKRSETAKPFKLDGKPFVVCRLPPLAKAVIKHLDSKPSDELFTVSELASGINSTVDSLRTVALRFAELAPYWLYLPRPVRTKVYGNPKAVAEMRRRLEAE